MRRFGLIGKPLTHSFSKAFFTKKFSELQLNAVYENYPLETIQSLPQLLQREHLQGLNVTIPYKEEVLPFLHAQDEIVAKIGACNCIKIKDGKLYGFNTDVSGFGWSLEPKLKKHHTKALILGTGGAAKAVAYSLQMRSIQYDLVSRKSSPGTISYEVLDEKLMAEYLIIINTTPLGTYPDVASCPPIPYHLITSGHLLFDLTYNPEQTLFLQKGKERGASTYNGYEMLVLQAEESWRIWNDDAI